MASRNRVFAFLFVAGALLCCACGGKAPAEKGPAGPTGTPARPTIVFMTDFGTANERWPFAGR